MFLPQASREELPGAGRIDGRRVHSIITSFTRDFLERYLMGQENGYPEENFAMFPEVRAVDVSYVKEWALSR